ncbi:hypothetical protein EJD97_014820, partial [Solanum chilense]
MTSYNLINVESRIILNFVRRLHRDKVGRLSHPLHNNPYGVMLSSSLRKTNHKVHINGIPLPRRNLDNQSKTARLKMFCLNLLTIRTLGHIFSNVLLYAIPPIDLLKIMIHLGRTWTYGISGTMGLCNNLRPQIIHIWYTLPNLVPKYDVTS